MSKQESSEHIFVVSVLKVMRDPLHADSEVIHFELVVFEGVRIGFLLSLQPPDEHQSQENSKEVYCHY